MQLVQQGQGRWDMLLHPCDTQLRAPLLSMRHPAAAGSSLVHARPFFSAETSKIYHERRLLGCVLVSWIVASGAV